MCLTLIVYILTSYKLFYKSNVTFKQFFSIFPGIDRTVSYFPDGISRDFPPGISHSGISRTTLLLFTFDDPAIDCFFAYQQIGWLIKLSIYICLFSSFRLYHQRAIPTWKMKWRTSLSRILTLWSVLRKDSLPPKKRNDEEVEHRQSGCWLCGQVWVKILCRQEKLLRGRISPTQVGDFVDNLSENSLPPKTNY